MCGKVAFIGGILINRVVIIKKVDGAYRFLKTNVLLYMSSNRDL